MMDETLSVQVPWGSKGTINRAGEALRAGRQLSSEELDALDTWRASHRYILNTFNVLLRGKTAGTSIVVAQRLKRRITIIDKLFREPKMQLARMDDVAGCRLIFDNVPDLYDFRTTFLKSKFKHKRKNTEDKYDYIKHPKSSGYRGVHDVFEYNVKSRKGAPYNGLMIEVQYRTYPQHAWSIANEVVTGITSNKTKFNKGDDKYLEFFRLASEIIARAYEQCKGVYYEYNNKDIVNRFIAIDAEINLMRTLKGLHRIDESDANAKNLILQVSDSGALKMHQFDSATKAIGAYFHLEKEFPGDDIVLIRADNFDFVRVAYRNYFADVGAFVDYTEGGKTILEQDQD
jgi:putative GTP pyrophosphokinase